MKILLIRHGETTGDLEDRYGGSYDDHLTKKGREQLAQTATQVADKGIEIIFHSPLIRAQESAKIISDAIGCPIEQRDGLEERHYGVLTGLTKQEALEKYPEAVEAHKDPINTDPEGESFEDFNNRIVTTFEEIRKQPHKTIAILAHGGSLKRILSYLDEPLPDSIADGGIIEIEV
ncbi:histidine phosphatase family protein [Candidatus Kaiserbacteria bacterium]|nr:histidine phosphatase family protein [Candidatus Kaiserbacteria bacterium]